MTASRPAPSPFHQLAALGGGLVLLFVVAPVVGMFVATPMAKLTQAAGDAEVQASIGLTLWTSMAGTLLLAIPAIPCAWLLARTAFPGRRLVLALLDLPVVIPHSAAGIALLGVLNRDSWAGQAAESLGFSFIGSAWGVTVAMAFVSLPFLLNAAREGFAAVPERLEKAARTLGAGPARVFCTISLPLAWRAVLSGVIMMFARGLSEFGAVIVVAYHPMISPILVYERFTAFGLSWARPVAVLFLIVCLIVFIALRLVAGRAHATR